MVDGLRGIAAFAVVLHHLEGATTLAFGQWAPSPVIGALHRGFLGVDIFFVLSGFVIAYSLRHAPADWGFVGRFALRRSIRLDPPYWVSITFELGVAAVVAAAGYTAWQGVSLPQLLAHVAYLQEILGYPHIVAVYWTLCFEIQFYLTLVVLVILSRRASRVVPATVVRGVSVAVLATLFVASLAGRFGPLAPFIPPGLALIRWYQFAIGCLVWWTHDGAIPRAWLYGAWVALAFAVAGRYDAIEQLLAIPVSAAILLALGGTGMQRWLSSSWLQFLGSISYSLYLFHATVGWRTIRVLGLLLPASPAWAAFAFLCGVFVAVGMSWLIWRLVEQPSLGWSRRISLAVPSTGSAVPAKA